MPIFTNFLFATIPYVWCGGAHWRNHVQIASHRESWIWFTTSTGVENNKIHVQYTGQKNASLQWQQQITRSLHLKCHCRKMLSWYGHPSHIENLYILVCKFLLMDSWPTRKTGQTIRTEFATLDPIRRSWFAGPFNIHCFKRIFKWLFFSLKIIHFIWCVAIYLQNQFHKQISPIDQWTENCANQPFNPRGFFLLLFRFVYKELSPIKPYLVPQSMLPKRYATF